MGRDRAPDKSDFKTHALKLLHPRAVISKPQSSSPGWLKKLKGASSIAVSLMFLNNQTRAQVSLTFRGLASSEGARGAWSESGH